MVAHLNESFVVHLLLETAHHKHVVHHPEQENEQLKLQVAKLTQNLQIQHICMSG